LHAITANAPVAAGATSNPLFDGAMQQQQPLPVRWKSNYHGNGVAGAIFRFYPPQALHLRCKWLNNY
jgi:hypothetical protein